MKRWIPIISSFVLTVGLAAGLTIFDSDWSQVNKSGMKQLQSGQALQPSSIYLGSDNIVDVMAGTATSLHSELARVQIKPQLLAVDVRVHARSKQEEMFRDLAELAQLSFYRTENVRQLLVRVLIQDHAGKERLLASWEAERSLWLELGEKENVTASRIIPEMNGFYLTKAGEDFFKP